MSDYGLDVYCGDGLKLLSTAEMGLAFRLQGTGSFTYGTLPNYASQAEFPTSPDCPGWSSELDSQAVVNMFHAASVTWVPEPVFNVYQRHRNGQLSITYANKHISTCSTAVYGLTNTVGGAAYTEPAQSGDSYGFVHEGSLIGLAHDVDSMCLHQKYEIQAIALSSGKGMSFLGGRKHVQLFVVPLLSEKSLIAIKPHSAWVGVGLFARTPTHEIYIIHSPFAKLQTVTVYVYDTLQTGTTPAIPSEFGIEVFSKNGLCFSSRNPPLLPLFVSTSASLHSVPTTNYPIACVFSTFSSQYFYQPRGRTNPELLAYLFNGVRWNAEGILEHARMGFLSRTKLGRSVSGASLYTMASYDEQVSVAPINNNQPGVFMGVVAY